MGKTLVLATMEVYDFCIQNFLPTPKKSHYVFNLRDFARVMSGVLLLPSKNLDCSEKLLKLWIHEIYRVFYDRLIDDEDRDNFFGIVRKSCQSHFKTNVDKLLGHFSADGRVKDQHVRNLIFGNFKKTDEEGSYNEMSDLTELTRMMENHLLEYNQMSKNPMNLVMFKFAIEHISRVSRVLNIDNGHCLLVGVGGSGRKSVAKMAAYIADYSIFQVEMTRFYSITDWREDMKKLLFKAGIDGKPIVFLFSDIEIKEESFMEDIGMILNSGDLPNLFQPDEKAEILEKMQSIFKAENRKNDPTPLILYNCFIDRVKKNLHIVLAMSPIGASFRNRLRMFPSLINCCTIDWFQTWPDDALEMVANKFFEDINLDESYRHGIVTTCKQFHSDIITLSARYFNEMKRHYYVTPTSYLELVSTFKSLLKFKRKEIETLKNRYMTGLEKLSDASLQVVQMQQELTEMQPQLIETSKETELLIVRIEEDTVEVDAKRQIVSSDKAIANEAAMASKAIKDECETDLAEALPQLEAALAALDTLKPSDITNVKSMKNPPLIIKVVMEAICVMLNVKPERKPDPSGSGRMIDDYWSSSQKVLNDMKFIDRLKSFDKDDINPNSIRKIREKYIPDPQFVPGIVKQASTACEGLCAWVRAMDSYDRVAKVVAPKKEKLAIAEAKLAVQIKTLQEKELQLKTVEDKLQKLNDQLEEMTIKKENLIENIDQCSKKLTRAGKLIGGLGGERERWQDMVKILKNLYNDVPGDVLVSAGVISYLGAFSTYYRKTVINDWHSLCLDKQIPCSQNFSMTNILGDNVLIRRWQICGLPVDTFSTDNGIIIKNSLRWPLIIDPQGQANKWIKNFEKDNGLCIVKLTDKKYLQHMENCVQFGKPILIENVGEELDPLLDPILMKQIFRQQGVDYIKLGDKSIEYNQDFRLYITTNLRNPHYLPEVSVKICLINFMITEQGLEDQLLGIVAAKEKPEFEEKKNSLIIEGAENKKQLKEIEDKILQVLTTSKKANILEDETAIEILSSSKILSEEIAAKQEIASKTEDEIDKTRNLYVPVSKHSTVLFFCISDLAFIDPMYQYSLHWFINFYIQAIETSKKSDFIDKRIELITSHFTESIYANVCRSLFEKDKLLFSFMLCIGILKGRNTIDDTLWRFFLTGGVALDNLQENPEKGWLSDKSWGEIVRAGDIDQLSQFPDSIRQEGDKWKSFYELQDPQNSPLPEPYKDCTELEFLVILRCLRGDKLIPAIQKFIINNLGNKFIESGTFDLKSIFADSASTTPLIFILSPGADPLHSLLKFGMELGYKQSTNIHSISLGQGQGVIAAKMIDEAIKVGDWVILQNCHLATSWMPNLDRICQEVMIPGQIHPDFRLWLTSYPSEHFPVSILQNGIKITNEPPSGLRSNLLRSYLSSPFNEAGFYNDCDKPDKFHRMLFGLCFFHTVVQERKQFGSLGWNIPYEFNDSDLVISSRQMRMLINDYDNVPLDALVYLTGECNYGGRVTDDKDRRLLLSLLDNFFNFKLIESEEYCLSTSGDYHTLADGNYDNYISYIKNLPTTYSTDVFGLHNNANITKDYHESQTLLMKFLSTQPGESSNKDKSANEAVMDLATDILSKLPNEFNIGRVSLTYPVLYNESMNTVLRQELIRYNSLTSTISTSLGILCKAIKGFVVMSQELEGIFDSLLIGKVPSAWLSKSYPSLKPLGSYINDLLDRLHFFENWIENGPPTIFWLSGFYFTQSFLTGVSQNYARKYRISIDLIKYVFQFISESQECLSKPEDGALINGLFLEGARWDASTMTLAESLPRVLYEQLPVIWLKPVKSDFVESRIQYSCPIYKTTSRRGVLSTTGHSTNFVRFLEIPISDDKPVNHWINRSVAAICQLDD